MFNIKSWILKKIYKLLIFKVTIVDKVNFIHYKKLITFCELELFSNIGPIKFLFKEDRRKYNYRFNNFFTFDSFLIELKVPDNIVLKKQEINDIAIIVIKLTLFKIDYNILAKVLLDTYLTSILNYIEKETSLVKK